MKKINFPIFIGKVCICLLLIFVHCNSFAQQKRNLSYEDYKLWNTLQLGTGSADGIWTSYSKSYLKVDTLFLKNTSNDIQYVFVTGHSQKITLDGSMFAYMKNDSLFVLKTATGKQFNYPKVSNFELTKNGSHIMYSRISHNQQTLTLSNNKTGKFEQFQNVSEYRMNPQQTILALIQNNEKNSIVRLIDLKGTTKEIVISQSDNEEFQNLTWNETGNAIACYSFNKVKNEYNIILTNNNSSLKNMIRLDQSNVKNSPIHGQIIKTKLYLSKKGDKVFFDVLSNNNNVGENSLPKVWKSSDKQLPPKTDSNILRWHVWIPEKNKIYPIEDEKLKPCALTEGGEKVVLLDNSAYLPMYNYKDRYSDFYLMDLNTGEKRKIIEKQLNVYQHFVSNKESQYIIYFKDSHWWSYNTQKNLHTCLTKNIATSFNRATSDRLDEHQAYGFGGWTSTGQILLYDEYDIWLVALEGDKKQKITNGASLQIRYRLYENSGSSIRDSFIGFSSNSYNLAEGLILKTINTEKLSEGFGIWNATEGFKQIVHKNAKILYARKFNKKNTFHFIESAFDISPQLVTIDLKGKKKIIAKSNEQQKKFHWGKSELIHYESPDGKKLNGALFYPANYNVDKKYPMIVSIYENMSYALHEYVAPSLENYEGLNITNLTSEGYFVLLPDIEYILNKPGHSALNCVLSAVDQAIKITSIDENNLGLIGHSFGGFETTYIAGQTDRFKTIVAGSGVTDLLSFYLDIDSSDLSNMERFESSQFRNQIPFTENDFLAESPIMNVKGINTPLLLWTGDNDQMVKSSYSIKMYAALWRLQKKSTLLIYPDEPHVLLKPKNQIDLSIKIMNWFNYYLKNSVRENWMNN